MAIEVLPDLRLVRITLEGRLDIRDVQTTITQFRALPLYQPGMDRLWDLRQATLDITGEDVRQVVALLEQLPPATVVGKVAFVTASSVAYGLVRMLETYAELASLPSEAAVFRTLDEALAWLSVDPRVLPDG
jgi:hypothetical protein